MVGVGVLAGSSVMLLTIAWAGSLLAGRCDLDGPNGTATDLTLTRPLDPFGTGVTTDEQTRYPQSSHSSWSQLAAAVQVMCTLPRSVTDLSHLRLVSVSRSVLGLTVSACGTFQGGSMDNDGVYASLFVCAIAAVAEPFDRRSEGSA